MSNYSLVVYAIMGVLGVLYGLLFVVGAYASVEALLDLSWRFLVALPLGTIGALGVLDVAKFFAGSSLETG